MVGRGSEIQPEIIKKEKEKKRALQSEAAKGKKHKDEEEKKRVMAAKSQGLKNLQASPRNPSTKHSSASPTSTSLVATQGGHQKLKIIEPPSIKKKPSDEFDEAIGVREQEEDVEVTGLVTKEAYTPKDLNSDDKTGQSIVSNAKCVTESVDIDFSKEGTNHDFKVLFKKVTDKMDSCNATINNLDAIRFVQIIKDFKTSNFGHIFSKHRY